MLARTPILFMISHMIWGWGPHCWWMESRLFSKIEPWELGGQLEESSVGSRRLLPAKCAKGKQNERMEINFNESWTVLICNSVNEWKTKKEEMEKEDKRIGRIRIEINMADDEIRKRTEGIWLVKYFISTWGTTLTRKAHFYSHFINIESFFVVKLWNA